MQSHRAKLIAGGKLVVPAAMRRSLGIATGDTVVIELGDGEIRVRTLEKSLERAQAMVRERIPKGHSLVDDLISDRRAEAARE